MKKVGWLILIVLFIILLVFTAQTYLGYQRDIRVAREQVLAGSQVIETACGPIEYAISGEGPAVLVVHGAGGGYDQGLEIARSFVGGGFRFIVPSRFGYLRTPISTNASATAQADAYVCLLDALNIRRVAIVGMSAGGPSSMQFALRHPERSSALVLLVPAAYAPQTRPAPRTPASNFRCQVIFSSDFTVWLAMKVDRSIFPLPYCLGIPPSVQTQLTPAEEKQLSEFMQSLLPIMTRLPGLLNDINIYSSLNRYPLERITVPTLAISASDDPYNTFISAQYTAQNIQGAKFIGLKSGGHLLIGHEEKIRLEVDEFLKQHT
ncbi:putative hydrolase or acyltransferase of alpha/beta superfamily [Candidatus Methanoperedens nitroreducens]|uniref:Putative hydrolase or acyltransferase of alpha/beta superfamily n=1 Tax=Candidatus Methanoperedens nitratireducens TaxID=1392998 RepID=A0A062V5L8_9EURY|nr:alpha/beta hydrolase [Candidatus Methanoperedens nitroreducens]KCZ71094.1 putative hydrolase or acyltransferase of alpha/beta superfamily [Candidatus Methanoperedens nitroreducens]MDJ1421530.1 alpha/beta hydrolase [Candidatus Methanoperedens sp.]